MIDNIEKLYNFCKKGNIKEFIKICDSYTDFNYKKNVQHKKTFFSLYVCKNSISKIIYSPLL